MGEGPTSAIFTLDMHQPAGFEIEQRSTGPVAALHGDWTSTGLRSAGRSLQAAVHARPEIRLDFKGLGQCDTAGAYILFMASGHKIPQDLVQVRPEMGRLFELVQRAVASEGPEPAPRRLLPRNLRQPTLAMLGRLGHGVIGVGWDFWHTMGFNGRLVTVLARSVVDPRRLRWAPLISLAERAGLDAIPIVAVTAFFIGAVIAFIGANMLSDFGAQVFTVELIGIAVLREFGVVITAILLAGRSASSFAAEIGAMKMNQEIDAMQVMGVDPFEALVVPRFLALLLTIPILTFVAVIAGLAGGLVVTWAVLDLGPVFFVKRIADNVGAKHFWVGMVKAPVFAMVIAAIGCRQGTEVTGDVESLGRRVTSAVVQAIFSIILIDAVFALIYTELNI